jgi:hypothetical protein
MPCGTTLRELGAQGDGFSSLSAAARDGVDADQAARVGRTGGGWTSLEGLPLRSVRWLRLQALAGRPLGFPGSVWTDDGARGRSVPSGSVACGRGPAEEKPEPPTAVHMHDVLIGALGWLASKST